MAENEAQDTGTPKWITRVEAAEILGISVSGVRKYEREGKLRSHKKPDGSVVLDAAEVAALADGATGTDPLSSRALAHLEKIYSARLAVLGDARVIIEEQRTDAVRLNARISELETRIAERDAERTKLAREMEEITTLRHTREIEVQEFERDQGRKDRLIDEASPLVAALFAKLAGGKAGLGGDKATARAIQKFRDSLTPEQANAMAAQLSPSQLASLMVLLGLGGDKSAAEESPQKEAA